ncbi:MAG TPA: ATP-binding protein, partial [Pyrinomonadaceae bacterium]|nr:ATP-binding protein [Pyrinomonadaceae bacterium]
ERVRSRIATDLHDDIGASLTQIAILSEVAQAQSKGNGATESLTKITNVSNELVGTMSDIVWSINPTKDHLSDLTQRMRRFASDSLSAKGIIFHFNSTEVDQEIVVKSNLRREVFLIFKESINNIVKHSQAKHVEIILQISDEDLILKIVDDGKGFESEKVYENSLSSISMGKNGILSIKKRAEEMNGELEVFSAIGKGTTIELKLPMEIGQTQIPNKTF